LVPKRCEGRRRPADRVTAEYHGAGVAVEIHDGKIVLIHAIRGKRRQCGIVAKAMPCHPEAQPMDLGPEDSVASGPRSYGCASG
jgi:hypothetical protein